MKRMTTVRTAVSIAAAGTAVGVAGLVLLAGPAGAGEPPPVLPQISAEELVSSVLDTEIPAFAGSVTVNNNLGLPIQVPGLPSDDSPAKVYSAGDGRARLSLPSGTGERTVVNDGSTVWIWDSADKSVRKLSHDQADKPTTEGRLADPTGSAASLISAMRQDSTVTVDGTARIAGRSVYQLVLTPKPTEKTLLREIRVAVDSELRVPLELSVLANGQADPALRIGFTEFTPGAQDDGLFSFTPPAGATVTEGDKEKVPSKATQRDWLSAVQPQVIGTGWDTVLAGKLPAGLLTGTATGDATGKRGAAFTPKALLDQFGKKVSGSYGDGWLISTSVGGALVTSDGRVAVGAVPEQVLADAVGQVK